MRKERVEEIGKKLQVFSFDGLQNLITLFDVLQREEISVEDVKEFVAFSVKAREAKEANFRRRNEEMERMWKKNSRPCPLCGMPLALRPINIPKGKADVKGYTCHWFCPSEECTFEEYTKEDFQEIYRKIMEV